MSIKPFCWIVVLHCFLSIKYAHRKPETIMIQCIKAAKLRKKQEWKQTMWT